MSEPLKAFEELLRLVLDGSATEDDREELAKTIVQHPGYEPELVDALTIHSLLLWQCDDLSSALQGVQQGGDECDATLQAKLQAQGKGFAWKATLSSRASWRWAATILTLIAGGALVLAIKSSVRSAPIAQIIAAEGVQWTDDSTALRDANAVESGRLNSSAGSFTLKFRSGPTVRFSGPSKIDIKSDMLIAMEHGQATADVPKEGVGFTIKTPNVYVIDQGTRFGVAAGKDGDTDVVVFEGKVDLQNQIQKSLPEQRLVRGDAVKIDAAGAVNRIMQIGQNVQGEWWTTGPDEVDSTILEVRDNVPVGIGTQYSCFQIAFGGLKDDALAYADRTYQWNGLSARGLPQFLLGADLVRTFNDYRYMPDLEMVVTLRKPAHLFVFFDDRVPVPEWLETQFEDTGVDIGLDEGMHELTLDLVTADGGGNSIDRIFSVWRRRCVDLDAVRLGPVGPTQEARAMYGIAATPLKE